MFSTLGTFMAKHSNESSATRLEYNQLMNHMNRLSVSKCTYFFFPFLNNCFLSAFLSRLVCLSSYLVYLQISLLLSCCANFLGVCSVLAPFCIFWSALWRWLLNDNTCPDLHPLWHPTTDPQSRNLRGMKKAGRIPHWWISHVFFCNIYTYLFYLHFTIIYIPIWSLISSEQICSPSVPEDTSHRERCNQSRNTSSSSPFPSPALPSLDSTPLIAIG